MPSLLFFFILTCTREEYRFLQIPGLVMVYFRIADGMHMEERIWHAEVHETSPTWRTIETEEGK